MIQARGRNPILDQAWGISPGADRVWAQIAGIAPSTRPWERLFVVLQAFIDESYTEGSVFVMAGYIASAQAWARFSLEWEELLPLATVDEKGNRRFKMSEMAEQGRMPNVSAFYRIIEKHAIYKLSCKINIGDLQKALDRIWMPQVQIIYGIWKNPYYACFRGLIDSFHQARFQPPVSDIISVDEKVDFYFDRHSSAEAIQAAWSEYIGKRSELRATYATDPRFEDDLEFLPLQAADFWAWWIRKGFEDNNINDILTGYFGHWELTKPLLGLSIEISEDQIASLFYRSVARTPCVPYLFYARGSMHSGFPAASMENLP